MNDSSAQQRRLQRLAWLLDESIRVPVIGARIGLDSIIGLVPVAGDIVGGVMSAYILVSGWRSGASLATLLRMALNVVIEVGVGAVPLVGDLFDMGFKANRRNVALLESHFADPDALARRSFWRLAGGIALIVIMLAGFGALALWLTFKLAGALLALWPW